MCKYIKRTSKAIKPREIEYNYLVFSIILGRRAARATTILVIVYAHTHTCARSAFSILFTFSRHSRAPMMINYVYLFTQVVERTGDPPSQDVDLAVNIFFKVI